MINSKEIGITVARASGKKCPRCGLYHLMELNFDNLCDRCCRVMIEDWPDHEATPMIKEAYRMQREKWSTPLIESPDVVVV